MGVIVDTSDAERTERFEHWADAHQRVFQPLEVSRSNVGPFSGRMWRYGLGGIAFYRIAADASVVRRTVSPSDSDWMHVALVMRGRCAVSQDERGTLAGPGDITSYSSLQPYVVEALTPFELLVVNLPHDLLHPHVDRARRSTATALSEDQRIGRIIRPFLIEVLHGLEDGAIRADDTDLAESLVDLVQSLHARRQDRRPAVASGSPAALRIQIRGFIDANLRDPDLSREMIARAHFISTSYLDKLFASEGMSTWQYIRDKRLDRCRRDLGDVRLADDSILEIASRWGFANAAHFSRTFSAVFGQPPREFRKAALAGS